MVKYISISERFQINVPTPIHLLLCKRFELMSTNKLPGVNATFYGSWPPGGDLPVWCKIEIFITSLFCGDFE